VHKTKGPKKENQAKIRYGQLCLWEKNISFKNTNIIEWMPISIIHIVYESCQFWIETEKRLRLAGEENKIAWYYQYAYCKSSADVYNAVCNYAVYRNKGHSFSQIILYVITANV
jgi:hypothetical protein